MTSGPMPHVFVMVGATVFMGIALGPEIAAQSFPAFEQPDTDGGFLGGALDILGAIIKTIWGVVLFIFNLLTFNIPGAPWYVRTLVSTYFGGVILWTVAGLVRGGK